jgi:hypothetical protein
MMQYGDFRIRTRLYHEMLRAASQRSYQRCFRSLARRMPYQVVPCKLSSS